MLKKQIISIIFIDFSVHVKNCQKHDFRQNLDFSQSTIITMAFFKLISIEIVAESFYYREIFDLFREFDNKILWFITKKLDIVGLFTLVATRF